MKKFIQISLIFCCTIIISLSIVCYLIHSKNNVLLKFKCEAMLLTNTKLNIDIQYDQKK